MKKLAEVAYHLCRILSIIGIASIPISFIAAIWTEGWFFVKVIATSIIVGIVSYCIAEVIDEELLD